MILRDLNRKHSSPASALGPIYLVGPTGAGKSSLACILAQEIGAEIIGADAFQVYAGLRCLTAQPKPDQTAVVRHHLVGGIPHTQAFDVSEYHRLATAAISEVQSRGLVPLVVGGTGLYVKALIGGLSLTPPADLSLRAILAEMNLPSLIERLGRIDPNALEIVDLKNRRRVERAIEICETSGQPLSNFRGRELPAARGALVNRDRADLHTRIAENVAYMFDAGVVNEVSMARNAGFTASQAIGFREICALLDGGISQAECKEKIMVATRQYARRQLTWFKHQSRFPELNLSTNPPLREIIDLVTRAT